MDSLAKLSYGHAEIKNMLLGNRKIAFRYELLDKNNIYLGEVTAEGYINNDYDTEIKRVASFTIKEIKDIDQIDNRIKPYFRLWTPKGWVDYPLGVFLISSPNRTGGISVTRDVECYDKSIILKEDKFVNRYKISAGTNYVQAVMQILSSAGITSSNIEATSLTVNVDIEFEIGTDKLTAINKLLKAINYTDIWFDTNGIAIANGYTLSEHRNVEEEYLTDKNSIIKSGAEQSIDVFNCPNKFVRYLETPELGTLIASYTNDNPSSKLSTVSRGRTIVDIASVSDIADQTTLNAYVQRLAEEKTVKEKIVFATAIMPHHTCLNCLQVDNKELNIAGKYIETGYEIDLRVGGNMKHICKKVVTL